MLDILSFVKHTDVLGQSALWNCWMHACILRISCVNHTTYTTETDPKHMPVYFHPQMLSSPPHICLLCKVYLWQRLSQRIPHVHSISHVTVHDGLIIFQSETKGFYFYLYLLKTEFLTLGVWGWLLNRIKPLLISSKTTTEPEPAWPDMRYVAGYYSCWGKICK